MDSFIEGTRDLAALDIKPRPSPLLLVCGGGAHVLAGVAVLVSSLPPWIRAGFIVGIALALGRFVWQYGFQGTRGFIARLELLDSAWRLETGDGTPHRARLTGGYAHLGIVVLNFRLESGGRRSLALLPDAADSNALRRLRVWLRVGRDEDGVDPP
ncbi:MAG: hypothetical protein P9F19_10565 [Candidatus Contendobacter sp.]|nr:hypothetical protein [Candidatus Contendobacter sp.]MDG4557810.1 hypothetical protein [Candidatus Contendobacter sp.]